MKDHVLVRRFGIVLAVTAVSVGACKDPSEQVASDALTKAFPPEPEYCWLPDGIEQNLHVEEKPASLCVPKGTAAEAAARCVVALKEAGVVAEADPAFLKEMASDGKNTPPQLASTADIYKPRGERFAGCSVAVGENLRTKLSMKTVKQKPLIKCGTRETVLTRLEKEGDDRVRAHYERRVKKLDKQTAIDAACGEVPFDPAEQKDVLLVKANGAWTVAGHAPPKASSSASEADASAAVSTATSTPPTPPASASTTPAAFSLGAVSGTPADCAALTACCSPQDQPPTVSAACASVPAGAGFPDCSRNLKAVRELYKSAKTSPPPKCAETARPRPKPEWMQ